MYVSYRAAIKWIVDNDDTEFLDDEENTDRTLSVTASLVADLFNKTDTQVWDDLTKVKAREAP